MSKRVCTNSLAPAEKRDVYYSINAWQQIFEQVKRCEDVIKEHKRRCLGQIELAAIERGSPIEYSLTHGVTEEV